MRDDYRTLSDIQSDVLGYLETHPDAVDTAEGIRQWWLIQQRMAMYSHEVVRRALHELPTANILEMNLLEGGQEVFGLARREKSGTNR